MLSSKRHQQYFLYIQLLYYWRTLLLLISTFYLSLLSLQTVIYVPFFVFQKIAFTSSIVDPDQNAHISVTSIMKFQDRREIRRLINTIRTTLPKLLDLLILHIFTEFQFGVLHHDFFVTNQQNISNFLPLQNK